jgi:lysozyme-like protein
MRHRERHRQDLVWLAVLVGIAIATRPARIMAKEVRRMTLDDLRALARSVGFPDDQVDVAAAVAMAESRGDPNATRIVSALQAASLHQAPERSFGLWQVNTLAHPEFDEGRLLDPDYSARAAFTLSQGGANWHPWSTHNPGPHGEPPEYLKWMPGGANA